MRLLGKQTTNMFKKKSVFLSLAVILLTILIASYFGGRKNIEQPITSAQIVDAARREDCSSKMISSVKHLKPDISMPQDSIKLLNYRASCYYSNGDFRKSLDDYSQLRVLYEHVGEDAMVKIVEGQLVELKAILNSRDVQPIRVQPDANTYLEKAIKNL